VRLDEHTRVEDPAPGETADERHRLLPPTHADVAEDADGVVRADDGVPVRDEHGVHLADAGNGRPQYPMLFW
jgi:hypothetical protein